MKVAVPNHQGRIAPVFDTCRCLLIFSVTSSGDQVSSREDWSSILRHSRAFRLKELGVETLLCGGVSCCLEEQILKQGIRLFPWLAGEVSEVLKAFQEGRITDPKYAMPGRLGCRRREGRKWFQTDLVHIESPYRR